MSRRVDETWLVVWLASAAWGQRFEISFLVAVHAGAITGPVFVVLTKRDQPEPIREAGSWTGQAPFFGADVDSLAPGQPAVDAATLGFPASSLRDVPAGNYFVQAIANVYTQFHRSDGHAIWAHMDRWEGQQFTRSPGNL